MSAVYGLGKFHFRDDGGVCMGILTGQARKHIWDYSVDDCAQMLVSLSRANVKSPGFVNRVLERVCVDSVKDASFESLVNLMTGFARFGVKDSRKKQAWQILANELSLRLANNFSKESSFRIPDLLNAITAYSYPNINRPHVELFEAVSSQIRSHDAVPMTTPEVIKYLKACARVQYRDVEGLVYCGACLRKGVDGITSFSKEQLLDIYSSLNKLGAQMDEITLELQARGFAVSNETDAESTTWFKRRSTQNTTQSRNRRGRFS